MASQPRLIYRSERMRVVFQPAESDWLALSFNGGEFNDSGLRFFGDGYFAKRNVAAIGFVDTNSRWFPKADMQAALRAIRAEVSADQFAHAVTYGVSMGAWAALKYSRMLGATAALAFGPQWSINPALVSAFDNRYERFFKPALHTGMEIEAGDLCPNNYVFFDPLFVPDTNHAARIARHPNVHRVLQTFLGHPGIGYFTQTRLIDEVFALARRDGTDFREFRSRIRARRAGSTIYWMGRAEALRRKRGLGHFRWLVQSLEEAQRLNDLPFDHRNAIEPLVILTQVLLDAGQRERAQQNLAELWKQVQAGAAHEDLGRLFVRMGAFDRARFVAEKAVEQNPRDFRARLELVNTMIDTGDLLRANVEIDIIRARARERPVVWRRLRLLYSRLGRTEDVAVADAMLAKLALTRTPTREQARRATHATGADGEGTDGPARPATPARTAAASTTGGIEPVSQRVNGAKATTEGGPAPIAGFGLAHGVPDCASADRPGFADATIARARGGPAAGVAP